MSSPLERIKKKVTTLEGLKHTLHIWRFQNQKVVFTNGCFDLIHVGHIHTLSSAAEHGNKLIVALNTDASIKRIKSSNRPLQPEQERALIMAAFDFVDAVILFDEDTPLNAIKYIQPDVLVKGGDYKHADVVGFTEMQSWGGRVEIIPFVPGHSSSAIEEKVKKG